MSDLPDALIANPNLSDWVEFNNAERTVIISTGKVELGQGIKTAIATIAAEELDVSLEQVREATGFDLLLPDGEIATTAEPLAEELRILREEVDPTSERLREFR